MIAKIFLDEMMGGKAGKDWCGFTQTNSADNDAHWEMRTIMANFFCLKPSRAMFERMEKELVEPFTRGEMVYKGKYVATEQDLLNLFFNGR